MRSPLVSGMERVYPDHRRGEARECSGHFQDLAQRFDLSDALARRLAIGASVAWASWRRVTRELHQVQAARENGRGRRPSAQAVERLRRRQALQWSSYDAALKRLGEAARGNGHGRPTLAEIRARYDRPAEASR